MKKYQKVNYFFVFSENNLYLAIEKYVPVSNK